MNELTINRPPPLVSLQIKTEGAELFPLQNPDPWGSPRREWTSAQWPNGGDVRGSGCAHGPQSPSPGSSAVPA